MPGGVVSAWSEARVRIAVAGLGDSLIARGIIFQSYDE